MSDARLAAHPARFVRLVGWAYVAAAVIGLVVCGIQSVIVFRGAPGVAPDASARATALALVAVSGFVLVASIAFLKRRRWARFAVMALTGLGMVGALVALFGPSRAVEPPSPDGPAEYARLLRLISVANVFVPLAGCAGLAWILWRLRSRALDDQFR